MSRTNIFRHGITLVIVGLVFLIRRPIEAGVGVGASPIFYLPVVTLAAWYGGFGAGVAAVLTWGLLWVYFEIPPFGTLGIPSPTDQFRVVVFSERRAAGRLDHRDAPRGATVVARETPGSRPLPDGVGPERGSTPGDPGQLARADLAQGSAKAAICW